MATLVNTKRGAVVMRPFRLAGKFLKVGAKLSKGELELIPVFNLVALFNCGMLEEPAQSTRAARKVKA